MAYKPRKYPYWKIQYYIKRDLAWFDVQKQYFDPAEAEVEARNIGKCRMRLMKVEGPGKKRHPLPELDL